MLETQSVMPHDIEKLLGLVAITLVAVGSLWLLLKWSGNEEELGERGVIGYPRDRFPAQELTSSGPLARLAAIQLRLVTLGQQLPPGSDLALWLRPFLHELRVIMDRVYQVALVTQLYGRANALEQLAKEVEELEQQVAEQITMKLVAQDEDATHKTLNEQLAILRLCVERLALSDGVEQEMADTASQALHSR